MELILQTTDITKIPYVEMLLSSNGIQTFKFDENICAIEGSINILPVRLMVLTSDSTVARSILKDNGIST